MKVSSSVPSGARRGHLPRRMPVASSPGALVLRVLAALLLASVVMALLSPAALARTFAVTNTKDGGKGSLRRAILDANALPGVDTVEFRIPKRGVKTIRPRSPLPQMTDTTLINGYTQRGARPNTQPTGTNARLRVQLDGSLAGPDAPGLVVGTGADSSAILGLAINRFGGNGVTILASGAAVEGCFIGTNAAGTAALGNGRGVEVSGNNNSLGKTLASGRNLISGNVTQGVQISSGTGNIVANNLVGTDAAGGAAIGNGGSGVSIAGGANGNFVGVQLNGGNVVSGNTTNGVIVRGDSTTVHNNLIGLDASGTADLGNGAFGINVTGGGTTVVGGTGRGMANVISGNGIGGISISGGSGNRVEGNRVGTDVSGGLAVGNGGDGIQIFQADANTIGGPGEAGNLVSGNSGNGIEVASSQAPLARFNAIEGNRVGTNAAGDAALRNRSAGISVSGDQNTVGGSGTGQGNLVSGNAGDGVSVGGDENRVIGNRIGVQAEQNTPLPNAGDGVEIREFASENVVGGTADGSANRISANGANGVDVRGDGNDVLGNTISGNAQDGVRVDSGVISAPAINNTILGNSILANGTLATHLGIDLGPDGVTANDNDDADTGANNLQNFPQIGAAARSATTDVTVITGTLEGIPNTDFIVECFLVPVPDPSNHGEGGVPLGRDVTVRTNASGEASFQCASPVPQPGQIVTATATRLLAGGATSDTSEFAQNRSVTSTP